MVGIALVVGKKIKFFGFRRDPRESNETDAFIGISAPENLGTRERRVVPRPEPFEFDRVSPGAPVKKGPERVKTLGMPARRGSPVRAPRRRT